MPRLFPACGVLRTPGRPWPGHPHLKARVLICEVGTVPPWVSELFGALHPCGLPLVSCRCSAIVEAWEGHPFWEGGHGKVGCSVLTDPLCLCFHDPRPVWFCPGNASMREVVRPLCPCVVPAVLCGYSLLSLCCFLTSSIAGYLESVGSFLTGAFGNWGSNAVRRLACHCTRAY